MLYLGIDLAERNTAAVILDGRGEVLHESTLDAGPRVDPFPERMERLLRWWTPIGVEVRGYRDQGHEVLAFLEDVFPHAVRVDSALRLSGALWLLMWMEELDVELVKPRRWQLALGYKQVKGRSTKVWSKELAESLGYTPEKKVRDGRSLGRSDDLCDAYLIAHWARTLRGVEDESPAG